MKKPLTDQSTRDYLTSSASFDESIMVDAGAGSGKTETNAVRTAEIIVSGQSTIDRIVAITFTNKAAAELKERILKKLIEALERESLSDDQRKAVKQAIIDAPLSRFGTIHGFCSFILHLFPIEAAVDPAFEVIEGDALENLFNDVFETWWEPFLATEAGPEMAQLKVYYRFEHDDGAQLKKFFYSLFKALVDNKAPLAPPGCESIVYADLHRRIDALWCAVENSCNDDNDKLYSTCQQFFSDISNNETEMFCSWVGNENFRSLFAARGGSAAKYTLKKSEFADLKAEREEVLLDVCKWLMHRIEMIVHWASGQISVPLVALEKEKCDCAVMSNNDLIAQTAALLKNHQAIRKNISQRFDYISVDEMQDTSLAQTDILIRICAPDDAPDTNWEDLTLSGPKLFLIGDEKQAIFRFADADIMSYRNIKSLFENGKMGQLKELTTNFRSTSALVDYYNERFEETFKVGSDAVVERQCHMQELSAFHGQGNLPPVVHLGIPDSQPKKPDRVEAEAKAVANFIHEVCNNPKYGIDSEERKQLLNPCDILLLGLTTSQVTVYERVFSQYNISISRQGGSTAVFGNEKQDLLCLMQAIDNPFDRISLIAALKGPLFSFSDRQLADYCRHSGKRLGLYGSFSLDDDARDRVDPALLQALELLQTAADRKTNQQPGDVLQVLLDHSAIDTVAPHIPRASVSYFILKREIERIKQLTNIDCDTWSQTIIRYQQVSDKELAEGLNLPSDHELVKRTVRYMSIHKAKGLEAKVVILTDHLQDGRMSSSDKGDLRTTVRDMFTDSKKDSLPKTNFKTWKDDNGQFQVALGGAMAGFIDSYYIDCCHDEAESRRLLYVAATRAEHMLVLPCAVVDGKASIPDEKNFWSPLHVGDIPLFNLVVKDSDYAYRQQQAAALKSFVHNKEDATANIKSHPILTRKQFSSDALIQVDALTEAFSKWTINVQHLAKMNRPANVQADRYGTLVHLAFEHCLSPLSRGIKPTTAVLEAWCHQCGIDVNNPTIASVTQVIDAFLSCALFSKAIASEICRAEFPLIAHFDKVLLTGEVDLLFGDEDSGFTLVDYKTSTGSDTDLISRYESQLKGYAAVLEKSGLKINAIVILKVG